MRTVPAELATEVDVERFRREIQVAAKLRHPGIVPLIDAGEENGSLYYTMPRVKGETLREKMRHQGMMSVELAVRYTIEIADALSYAHEAGIVHRHIKPENIVIDGEHAAMTDCGFARALSYARPASLSEEADAR